MTFAYFNSFQDWAIIILIGVVLFGGQKIPELAKGLGEGIRELKKSMEPGVEHSEKENTSTNPPAV